MPWRRGASTTVLGAEGGGEADTVPTREEAVV